MADTKSRAMWLAAIADDNSPTTADCEAIAAELRRLDAVEKERDALADSCAAKADRIDRLGDAVERLTAERDHLRECLESNFRAGNEWRGEAGALAAERDALRAEVDRLRVDAERYRWLRTYPNNVNPGVYGPTMLMGSGLLRRDTYLDAAIDAARGAA